MRQRVKTLLEQVGLGSRAASRVQVLSGGERQRIAICRALLLKPDLILADEPTGNLDPATAKTILDLIETLCAQSALLIVTHDPTVAARMKRTLRLKDGTLHPEGAQHG
jgi:ABC-type lipoprotein export system ATPase subunit